MHEHHLAQLGILFLIATFFAVAIWVTWVWTSVAQLKEEVAELLRKSRTC